MFYQKDVLISELNKLDFWFCGPKCLCSKFQFDSVGQNSCFDFHTDGLSQFCWPVGKSATENYVLPNVMMR